MEVVLVSWAERCYLSRHHWIIADNHKDAEAFFAEVCEWSSGMPGEVAVFEDGEWEKDEELYNAIKSSTFDNLILGDSLKRNIQDEFEQFFQSREVYERLITRTNWTRHFSIDRAGSIGSTFSICQRPRSAWRTLNFGTRSFSLSYAFQKRRRKGLLSILKAFRLLT